MTILLFLLFLLIVSEISFCAEQKFLPLNLETQKQQIQKPAQPLPVTLLPDLVIEKVWLDSKNRIAFIIRNIGKGSIAQDMYSKVFIKVTYGNSYKTYLLGVIDPDKLLSKPGGFISYTSEIEISSMEKVIVEIDVTNQIQETNKSNNVILLVLTPNISPSSDSNKPYSLPVYSKPDFTWAEPSQNYPPIKLTLINKGTPFKGDIFIKISAVEDSNIKFEKKLTFTENNPWYNNQIIDIPLEFNWPKGLCSMFLHGSIDPENKINEINENNNVARIQVFPQSHPSLWIMDGRMLLRSGKSLWTVKGIQIEPIRIDSVNDVSLGFKNISINLEIYGINCSSKINTYKPKLKYIDKDCKEIEKELGPFQLNPGEGVPIKTDISIGLCKDAYVEIDTGAMRSKAWFNFTHKFLEEVKPHPVREPSVKELIYKPDKLTLQFNRSSKELLNGGNVALSKGDWTWFYRNEFFIEFLVRLRLKAKEPYKTRLTIKTIVVDWEDFSFTESKEVEFEMAENYIELIETVKMWPVPYAAKNLLKIIDEKTGKEIFSGIITCTDDLIKEVGWRPFLKLINEREGFYYQGHKPEVIINQNKKEVTIKFSAVNRGGPIKNKKWNISVEVQKQGKTIHRKTFEFNGAESGQIIDQKFTFKPIYDEYHTYKIRLLADRNFLSNKPEDLEINGSFYVPW